MSDIKGPWIVWQNYGYEGWKPTSFANLKDALCSQKYVSEWEITKKIEFSVDDDGKIIQN